MATPVTSVLGWVPFPSLQTSALLCRAPDFSNHADHLQYYSRNPGNLAGTSATPSNRGITGWAGRIPRQSPGWLPPGLKTRESVDNQCADRLGRLRVRRILVGLILALSLGVLIPAVISAPAFAGRGDMDSFGAAVRD